ncbi:MAG: inorganic pyrophosphatase [Cellvibrionaceae bacterium]|jgi:inorganic pyrophosphatase
MSFPKPFYRSRPHPWHGLDIGDRSPHIVQAYIEITPFDLIKYEIDKKTGYLRVDRPQRTSSQPPTLYGFIPRTFCGPRVKALAPNAVRGDEDPLDICVISDRPINRAEVILSARVVGGLQMIDGGEADDKIVAILEQDNVWGHIQELSELPPIMVERLHHYFLTYKQLPGEENKTSIDMVYGAEHAYKVIEAANKDYEDEYMI